MILRLAYRNLWRNKRRTLITLLSIGGGMMFGLFFTGIQDGTYKKLINSAAKMGSGHLTIEKASFRKGFDVNESIEDYTLVEQALSKVAGLQAYSQRISGQAMLSSSYGSSGVSYDAVVPRNEAPISPIVKQLVAGDYLSEKQIEGVIIGDRLAKRLKVEVGSKLVMTLNNRHNETTQELVRVRGLFHTGAEVRDGFYLQLPLPKAQKMLDFSEHEVSQVAIYLETYRQIPKISAQLRSAIDFSGHNWTLLSWRETMADLSAYIATDKASNYILQLLVFIIIAAGILNTILMSVLERQYEFGVMLALGMMPRVLFQLIVVEVLFLGLFGVIFGSILGWAVNFYFQYFPLDLSKYTGHDLSVSGFGFEPVLTSGLYVDHYLITCALVFLLVVLVGMYPALKAARTVPVKALKAL